MRGLALVIAMGLLVVACGKDKDKNTQPQGVPVVKVDPSPTPKETKPIQKIKKKDKAAPVKPSETVHDLRERLAKFSLTIGSEIEFEISEDQGPRPSFFSNSTDHIPTDTELMKDELQRIERLLATVRLSRKIQSLMSAWKIDTVIIINPYKSDTAVHVKDNKLYLTLDMNEQEVSTAIISGAKNN